MLEAQQAEPTSAERRLDRQLLGGMALCVSAAAIEVIIGFSVAHWVTITASKTMGYLVSFIALMLCVAAALLAWNVRRQLAEADDSAPGHGRRLFMANLNLLVGALVTALILAATTALITIRPNS